MYKVKIIIVIFFSFLLINSVKIDEEQEDTVNKFESAWATASFETGFTLDETAKIQVWNQYVNSPDEYKSLIDATSSEMINWQIEKYLNAKRLTGAPSELSREDVSDFSWGCVPLQTDFIPVTISATTSTSIQTIKTGGATIELHFKLEEGKLYTPVFPIIENSFSIYGKTYDGRNLIWTVSGIKPFEGIIFLKTYYSQECEVYINSDPDNAYVYFNNKKYYRNTNTSTVRDPGQCKVTIKKENYEDYEEENILEKGEIWTINAKLVLKPDI